MATRTAQPPDPRPRPLVVTADADLLDDLLHLAAIAGAQVDVASDPPSARQRFAAAPLVLIDADAAAACARARLPHRAGVVLVGREHAGDPPWGSADLIGAEHSAPLIGAEHIALLPSAQPWLVDRLSAAAGAGAERPARVVAVLGGRGGAGASVLAAGLSVTAARSGLRALLVDADPLGGGVDLVLGWEHVDGLRWPALSQTSGSVHPPALVDALPRRGDLAVLSWDRGDLLGVPAAAMAAALDAGRRGRELVVADLPRRLDDAAVMALAAADLALLVVPAELRACAAAARVAAAAATHTTVLSLVVRGPAPGRLKAREIARALGLPLVGTLRPESELARGLERGEPPTGTGRGPLAELCRRLLTDLGLPAKAVAA
ncbi:MAG TPA: septum site-determining protein Ssd [Micromonosporaceae bacterium]|nr:septum site-determining protein Ssd [Micromonosporaceae bacterium]